MNPEFELNQIQGYIDHLSKNPQLLSQTIESHFFPVLQRIFIREGFEVKTRVEINSRKFPFLLLDLDCKRKSVVVDFAFQNNLSESIIPHYVSLWAKKYKANDISEKILILRNAPLHWHHKKTLNGYGDAVRYLDFEGLKRYAVDAFLLSEKQKGSRAVIIVTELIETLIREIAQNNISLDEVEWFDLERIFYRLLKGAGFECHLTPTTKDGGRDIIACEILIDDVHWYNIEIKHWKSSKPGVREVGSFLETSIREGRKGALFISTSGVTESAIEIRTEMNSDYLRFSNNDYIVSSCKHYTQIKGGLWSPHNTLREFIYSNSY